MKKLVLALTLIFLFNSLMVIAQTTLQPGVSGISQNATSGASTGTVFALPGSPTQVLTWGMSLSSAPATSITVLLEGSFDNSTWIILDQTSNTSGDLRNVTTSITFVRTRTTAQNGGGNVTTTLITKQIPSGSLFSGGTLTGTIDSETTTAVSRNLNGFIAQPINVTNFWNNTPIDGPHFGSVFQITGSNGVATASSKVGSFFSCSTGTRGDGCYGGNSLVVWNSTHPAANFISMEVDVNNNNASVGLNTTPLIGGVYIASGGNFQPRFGIYVNAATGGDKFRKGMELSSGSVSDTGYEVGGPTGGLSADFLGKQLADGADGILLQRFTDSSPTGWLVRGVNAANNLGLFSIDVNGNMLINGSYGLANLWVSKAAPTISSGFGTSPSVPNNNGAGSFSINVGTGGTAVSGVIALNATAINGWNCFCSDLTTTSATVFLCKQTATSTTTATIGNFTTAAATGAWVASDIVQVSCFAR